MPLQLLMVRRRVGAVSNHEARGSPFETRPKRPLLRMRERVVDWAYVAFLEAKVDLRLSNNSTFTPLRRMMKLCWSTESVLFQAQ